jgi:3-deoxy-D-manno-octulosonic acid kinase
MLFDRTIIHQNDAIDYRFSADDFELSTWKDKAGSQELTGGRGGSQKIQLQGHWYVLRQYLRGGMVARILDDRYAWSGLKHSRPYLEQLAIQHAIEHDLPVPEIAAYRLIHTGLFYRAAIISRFVPNQGTLASYLFDRQLPEHKWSELGFLIKRMHDAGINHADLNANNILINNNLGFHLIDFDKAEIMPAYGDWAHGNIHRLLRSLKKIQMQRQMARRPFRFQIENWRQLVCAYD